MRPRQSLLSPSSYFPQQNVTRTPALSRHLLCPAAQDRCSDSIQKTDNPNRPKRLQKPQNQTPPPLASDMRTNTFFSLCPCSPPRRLHGPPTRPSRFSLAPQLAVVPSRGLALLPSGCCAARDGGRVFRGPRLHASSLALSRLFRAHATPSETFKQKRPFTAGWSRLATEQCRATSPNPTRASAAKSGSSCLTKACCRITKLKQEAKSLQRFF